MADGGLSGEHVDLICELCAFLRIWEEILLFQFIVMKGFSRVVDKEL
uniref:Uncharacterized protein n=1 Tax=Arundo donax TaxID=35708 RepID=A0A0A8YV19_ARUDO